MKITLIGLIFLSGNLHASGVLTWENTTIEVQADPLSAVVSVQFQFKNQSPKPVAVEKVVSTCNCVTAVSTKAHFGPGESGTIDAAFKVGERTGLQVKKIVVKTDEPGAPYLLTLRVQIPDEFTIRPKSVSWNVGDAAEVKAIEIDIRQSNLQIESVQSANSAFSAKLSRQDGKYRIDVRPISTGLPVRGLVAIKDKLGAFRSLPVSVNGK